MQLYATQHGKTLERVPFSDLIVLNWCIAPLEESYVNLIISENTTLLVRWSE